jgi:hypothetical protein
MIMVSGSLYGIMLTHNDLQMSCAIGSVCPGVARPVWTKVANTPLCNLVSKKLRRTGQKVPRDAGRSVVAGTFE